MFDCLEYGKAMPILSTKLVTLTTDDIKEIKFLIYRRLKRPNARLNVWCRSTSGKIDQANQARLVVFHKPQVKTISRAITCIE